MRREEVVTEEREEVVTVEVREPSIVERILQKTPWWSISVAFHCTLLLVLWVVKFNAGLGEAKEFVFRRVTIEKKIDEKEFYKDRKRDVVRRDTPKISEKDIKGPIVKMPKSDHNETPNDEDFKMAKGREECFALNEFDVPFAHLAFPVIGTGKGPRTRPGSYGQRLGGKKRRLAGEGGLTGPTEIAVLAALRWLARHQSPDGAWHPDTWSHECPAGDSCVGKGGGGQNDVGGDYPGAITGFALLAFLGSGHTHIHGDFRHTVKRALEYLKKIQNEEGKFEAGQGRRMYTHGIAALAAAEAYGMTGSPRYREMAQRAIDYIVYHQNPLGGWNYSSPSSRNDTSVSGWQFMALKSAKIAKLDVPREAIEKTKRWLEIASGGDYSGRFCYTVMGTDPNKEYKSRPGSIRMRSVGCLGYYFFGMADPRDEMMRNSGDVFLKNLPSWNAGGRGVDLYYWYYATLVNYQTGGKYWKAWNAAMKDALLDSQCRGGHADGSWAPVDKYSSRWSRPGITALCALCLEVYYRY